ncbi:MAG: MOSC domain-containing protein [Planctomycetales bacterium]|nr:MOSC domain-containing protein [Planctomycetales bacterium]
MNTGIYKRPVHKSVRVSDVQIEGDGQADLSVHGGPDKAVYAYPHEHYAFWREVLDRDQPFEFGQFGENLTVAHMLEEEICIGDIVSVGTVMLQVSQPRTPCAKLGIRMKMPMFPRYFMASMKCGFYLRVLQTGDMAPGDALTLEQRDERPVTVTRMFQLYHNEPNRVAAAREALTATALAADWRAEFERRLMTAQSS